MARLRTHNNRKLRERRRRQRRNSMTNSPDVKRWLYRTTNVIADALGADGWFKLGIRRDG